MRDADTLPAAHTSSPTPGRQNCRAFRPGGCPQNCSRHCVGFVVLFVGPAYAAPPRALVAKVERVSDGDAIIAITRNQSKLRIRLGGIDAPEVPHGDKPGQPFGEEARNYLDHLIGGKTVRVDTYGPDEYKRVLAVVWGGQVNVDPLMVAMGYAEDYRGAPRLVYCREMEQAEAKARRNRVGMWVQGLNYESPAAFRIREVAS